MRGYRRERVQRRALKIIYPEREKLCQKLFTSIEDNKEHKLYHLLPEENLPTHNFRELRRYKLPIINKNRLKNSHIFNYASQSKL